MQHGASIVVLATQIATLASGLAVRMGGSMSLSGPRSADALSSLRGLRLVAESVNQAKAYRTTNGGHIQLTLDIEDDAGDAAKVAEIYSRKSMDPAVDFLIIPHSSGLANVAANSSKRSHKVTIVTGITSPSLSRSSHYMFQTNVDAADYMLHGLRTVWAMGSRKVAVAFGTDQVDAAVCEGAVSHARRLGFEIIDTAALTTLMPGLVRFEEARALLRKGPDVVVACDDPYIVAQLVLLSRALGSNPDGFLLMGGASSTFVRAVGVANANYALSPTSWAPAPGQFCPVFGSSEGFFSAYRAKWEEDPSQHSAEAAAGALTLLAAVWTTHERAKVGPDALHQAMSSLNVPSFFGRLAFEPDGRRVGRRSATQQLLLGSGGSRRVVAVGDGAASPVWPVPCWEAKDLEVYPCPLGHRRRWENGTLRCETCEVGKFRGPTASSCLHCQAGRYSDEPGLGECKVCPEGTDCPAGRRSGLPNARAGYYRLPNSPLLVEKCINDACLEANQCAGHNVGVLCQQCEPLFTNSGLGGKSLLCRQCQHVALNVLVLFLVALGFALLVALVARATTHASGSTRAIHSVILKIILNYLDFAGTAFEAVDFRYILASAFGMSPDTAAKFEVVPAFVSNPFEAFGSLGCLVHVVGLEEYQIYVLLGLALMPLTFAAFEATSILRRRSRAAREVCNCVRSSSPQSMPSSDLSAGDEPTAPSLFVGGPSPMSESVGNARSPFTTSSVELGERAHRHMRRMILVGFMLYPVTINLLVVSFHCVELDTLRLESNLDVICTSNDHQHWVGMSTFGLTLYGFGLPIFFFVLLFRSRKRLLRSATLHAYGFLYNGFEPRFYYFETIFMLRKVALLLVASAPNMAVRMCGMVVLSWLFQVVQTHIHPFDNRGYSCLDSLELSSLRALNATVLARVAFDIRERLVDVWTARALRHPVVLMALALFPLACHAQFIISAGSSLYRNIVLKHIALKAEFGPEKLKWIERLCLAMDTRSHKMVFNRDRNSIDVSELCETERRYLVVALMDTMQRYAAAAGQGGRPPELRPELIATAAREAFDHCQAVRQERAWMLRQISKDYTCAGFRGRLLRWKSEVSLSLGGMRATKAHGVMRGPAVVRRADPVATVEELHEGFAHLWPHITDVDEGRRQSTHDRLFASMSQLLGGQALTPAAFAAEFGSEAKTEEGVSTPCVVVSGSSACESIYMSDNPEPARRDDPSMLQDPTSPRPPEGQPPPLPSSRVPSAAEYASENSDSLELVACDGAAAQAARNEEGDFPSVVSGTPSVSFSPLSFESGSDAAEVVEGAGKEGVRQSEEGAAKASPKDMEAKAYRESILTTLTARSSNSSPSRMDGHWSGPFEFLQALQRWSPRRWPVISGAESI